MAKTRFGRNRRHRPMIFCCSNSATRFLAESDLDQHGCRVAVDGAFGVGLGPRPEESVQRGQVFAEDWVVRFDRVAGQEKLIAAELIDRLSRVEEILITHQ